MTISAKSVLMSRRGLVRAATAGIAAAGAALLAACGGNAVAPSAGSTGAATTAPAPPTGSASSAMASASQTTEAASSTATSTTAAATTASTTAISSAATTATVAPAASGQKGQVTLTYWTWGQEELKTEKQNFFPQFEQQHPGTKVDTSYDTFAHHFDKLQTMAASSQAPDVYWQSVAYAWDFANNGLALDLQPFVNRTMDLKDYFQPVLTTLRFPSPTSGDLYAFPSRWVASILFYNKDLFQKLGVAPPDETWDYQKMIQAGTTLTLHGTDPAQAHFGLSSRDDSTILDSWIKAYGGQVLSDDFTKCLLDQPKAISTVQLAADLAAKQAISPKPGEKIGGQAASFESGTIAMTIEGSYQIDVYRQKAKFDWDVALVPNGPVRRSAYGGPDSVAVSKGTKHPDDAWALVQAYCGPGRPVSSYTAGAVPVYKPTAEQPAWLEKGKTPTNKKALLDTAQYVQGADFSSHWIEWRTQTMNKEIGLAFTGEKSALDACRAATAAVQAILNTVKINKTVHPSL